jgi:hypothetical protein
MRLLHLSNGVVSPLHSKSLLARLANWTALFLPEYRDTTEFKVFATIEFMDGHAGAEIAGVAACCDYVREGHDANL